MHMTTSKLNKREIWGDRKDWLQSVIWSVNKDLWNTLHDQKIDVDMLMHQCRIPDEKYKNPEYCQKLIDQYYATKLTLPIDDVPMRRICQILTNYGFETTESCEGHKENFPRIFFKCQDQQLLRDIAFVIESYGSTFNFNLPRKLKLWTASPYLNPESPLMFTLTPSEEGWKIDPKKQYNKLIKDLDIIGISIMDYFNQNYTDE